MRPPVAAAALVGLLATAACATTGCASSVRMMHEGTTYFERCRAGELDPAVSIPQRSACWARWLEYYTDGQPEPRVAYAERRAAALARGETLPPLPDNTPLPPLAPPTVDAAAAERRPSPPAGEASACRELCRPRWDTCVDACHEGAKRCMAACKLDYDTCSRACF
ncbi:MAG: hypothetical protein KC543_16015 [Myxococcales bacterium]|nr:hypothetical protein [Myxococcales bacterium]